LFAAVLASSTAQATISFSIQPTPVLAGPGDVGDAFDVVTNTGAKAVTIAGFSFEVSVVDPPINLTGANFAIVLRIPGTRADGSASARTRLQSTDTPDLDL
jgi:hypothetical protein